TQSGKIGIRGSLGSTARAGGVPALFFLKGSHDAIRFLEPTTGSPPLPARGLWRNALRARTGPERGPPGDCRSTRRFRADLDGPAGRAPRHVSLRPDHVLRRFRLARLLPVRGPVALVGPPNGLLTAASGREAHAFLAQPLCDFLREGQLPA